MRTLLAFAVLLVAARCQDTPPRAAPSQPARAETTAPALMMPRSPIQLPGGEAGVGLDDLQWSARLGRLLIPAGRTGAVDLIDPATGAVQQVSGFGGQDGSAHGHGAGSTSAVDGGGWLLAIDRSRKELAVADPAKLAIVAHAPLAAGPDYVRWLDSAREVWVTEPHDEQIEVFKLPAEGAPQPAAVTKLSVKGGPEALVFDGTHTRAYSNLWNGSTVAIDVASHAVVATWGNGCKGSRGLALDEAHGWLFVGGEEGLATALDVAHDGKSLGSAPTGKGVDIICYDPARRHLYVPAEDGTLTILGVNKEGALTVLKTCKVCEGAQGVVTDGAGRVFVGDPDKGQLVVVLDDLPPSRD